jgi:YVTN family beta-propeller protein
MSGLDVNPNGLRRRDLLITSAAWAGCGRKRGTGYPGYVFIANQEGRSIAAVELLQFSLARRIPLDAAPTAILAHPVEPFLYVLAPQTGTIYEIDSRSLNVRRHSRIGAQAVTMRLARDNRTLWVLCDEPKQIAGVSVATLQVSQRIRLPAAPTDFDLCRECDLAVVSFASESAVALLELSRTTVSGLIGAGAAPGLVRFRFDGEQVIAANRGGRALTIVDVRTRRKVVRLPLAIEPANFCFKADGGQLFITGPGMDAVAVVYPYSTEVAETLLAGRTPGGMAVTAPPSAEYLFASNRDSGDVTVMDIDSRKVLAVIHVGQDPSQIVITPDNQYALVLNEGSGNLAVIRVASIVGGRTRTAPLFTMIPVGSKPVSAVVRGI